MCVLRSCARRALLSLQICLFFCAMNCGGFGEFFAVFVWRAVFVRARAREHCPSQWTILELFRSELKNTRTMATITCFAIDRTEWIGNREATMGAAQITSKSTTTTTTTIVGDDNEHISFGMQQCLIRFVGSKHTCSLSRRR